MPNVGIHRKRHLVQGSMWGSVYLKGPIYQGSTRLGPFSLVAQKKHTQKWARGESLKWKPCALSQMHSDLHNTLTSDSLYKNSYILVK